MEYIFEQVWVETPVDTDHDGMLDLIRVLIKRPKSGKVPAVFVANPYMMHCNEDWYDLYDVHKDVQAFPQQSITKADITFDFSVSRTVQPQKPRQTAGFAKTNITPDYTDIECISPLYDHLLERGYASVFSAGLGTRGSQGITLSGSREEILAFRSVIDWLNGRCRAFTNLTDNIEIRADWCTGKVAMSARSYLGTMCIGVGATGVKGLETIIPEAGISNWYEYYRMHGLNLPALGWQGDDIDILAKYCFSRTYDPEDLKQIKPEFEKSQTWFKRHIDRESANYNRFWDERNYLNQLDSFKASALIIQGLNDWNVKPKQAVDLFTGLQARGIESKLYLHRGAHIYTYFLEGAHTVELIDRWLDHYLKGADNGVEKEDAVIIENNLDQKVWETFRQWPVIESRAAFPIDAEGEASFTDGWKNSCFDPQDPKPQAWLDELVLSDSANKLRFLSEPLPENRRISGTIKLTFEAKLDQPTAILSAMLADLGEDDRLNGEADGDEYSHYEFKKVHASYGVITRGWMNAQNRENDYCKQELKINAYYTYTLDLIPLDYMVRKGHRLALILYGMDAQCTQIPLTECTVTVKQDSIHCMVPIEKGFR